MNIVTDQYHAVSAALGLDGGSVFEVDVRPDAALLEGLPELGSGLEVWGELKPRTGRLVVTKAKAVPLPPKRVAAAPTAS